MKVYARLTSAFREVGSIGIKINRKSPTTTRKCIPIITKVSELLDNQQREHLTTDHNSLAARFFLSLLPLWAWQRRSLQKSSRASPRPKTKTTKLTSTRPPRHSHEEEKKQENNNDKMTITTQTATRILQEIFRH